MMRLSISQLHGDRLQITARKKRWAACLCLHRAVHALRRCSLGCFRRRRGPHFAGSQQLLQTRSHLLDFALSSSTPLFLGRSSCRQLEVFVAHAGHHLGNLGLALRLEGLPSLCQQLLLLCALRAKLCARQLLALLQGCSLRLLRATRCGQLSFARAQILTQRSQFGAQGSLHLVSAAALLPQRRLCTRTLQRSGLFEACMHCLELPDGRLLLRGDCLVARSPQLRRGVLSANALGIQPQIEACAEECQLSVFVLQDLLNIGRHGPLPIRPSSGRALCTNWCIAARNGNTTLFQKLIEWLHLKWPERFAQKLHMVSNTPAARS
mmetsp:Transcript_144957/g.255507  ORF Transcript_144957/g.255507 Transcript_144957/m.255507 type:complete len:323 (+) Transcript_144957:196-1164(+)